MTRRRARGPAPEAGRLVRERAVLFLESQPAPVSSALLAREILGLRHGSEAACASILGSVLGDDPRVGRDPDGRWTLREPPAAPGPAAEGPLCARAWAVWAVEDGFHAAAVVRLEGGRAVLERCEPDIDGEDAAPAVALGEPRPLSREAVARLDEAGADALQASWDVASLESCPHDRRHLEVPDGAARSLHPGEDRESGPFSLPALARAALGPPRPRTLERLAAALGLVFVDPVSPLARARLSAECLLVLLEREPLSGLNDARELRAFLLRGGAPAGAVTRPDARARELADLPAEPGVYRFFDREDRLLYVGKARDLRRRVGSYFAARDTPDPRTAPWIDAVSRIEYERSGSELEALLREAHQIASRAPSRNRQRNVHARTGKDLKHLVLVQKAERPGSVRLALVRGGILEARVLIGPRGGGTEKLRALVERLYFSDVSTVPQEAAVPRSSGPASARGRSLRTRIAPSRSAARAAASRALLRSWLRLQQGPVPALDPTDDPGPDEACDRILATASALARGETGVIYR